MRLDDYLRQLAIDLNDAEEGHEFTHWTREQLIAYINEGIKLIRQFKPELFSSIDVVKLTAGEIQRACRFQFLTKIYGQCTFQGIMLRGEIPQVDRFAASLWSRKARRFDDDEYEVREYYFDEGVSSEFHVIPECPLNGEFYVRARGLLKFEPFTLNDIADEVPDSGTLPALSQWVLYRALSMDTESQNLTAEGNAHYQQFMQMMGQQIRREKAYQRGTDHDYQIKEAISIEKTEGV